MSADSRALLPEAIERLIAEVMAEAALHFADGSDEVERELRAHFEDGLATGATPEALIERFGDPVLAGARIARSRPRAAKRNRGERGRWWMSPKEWIEELRRAARRLKRAPGFAAVVILTLGLGVGANTGIFTVLNAVLLTDLPYGDPGRLVRVYESRTENPDQVEYIRAPMLAEWRGWDEVFDGLGSIYTYREIGADLTDGDAPRRINVARISAGYFEALGAEPLRGRTFRDEESFAPGENLSSTVPIERAAIITEDLWTDHFASDRDIVGRTIELNGFGFEVVGVMPAGFNNPFGTPSDVWVPADLRPGGSNSFGNFYLSAVARLKEGVTVEAAQERLMVLSAAFSEAEPQAGDAFPKIIPLQDDIVGPTRQSMLWILAAAAGLVLLTACINVANLLFARGLGMDRDLALRSALGSGRARLVAGILTENGLLAAAGGLVGFVIGTAGVRGLLLLAPDVLPRVTEIRIGGPVFLFAFMVTIGALVVFGLTPALRMSRTAPADVLRSGDRAATVGKAVRRLRNALVVVQVAAALVLVTGATLLTRSFNALLEVPLGVEPEGVLTYEVHLPGARYSDGPARHAFHEELHDRIRALPGVESVGAVSWLPVNGRYHQWGFYWDPEAPDGSNQNAWFGTDVRVFAGEYLESVGIELLRGEHPSDVDLESEPMVWINQTVVEEVFGEVDPVGQQIRISGPFRRVMGIVEDIPYSAHGDVSRKSYIPHAQYSDNRNWALIQTVETRGDLVDLRERIRGEIAAIDGELVLYRPRSFEAVLAGVRAQDRFVTVLMGSFALLALVLSLVGTYGVLAGTVAGRTREFGIRMALGADRQSVRAMVLRYAAALTIPGVLLGVGAAWAASRWIESLLFGIEAGDPVTYGSSVLAFALVGLLAAAIPAARATRVDTIRTLSAE